MKEILSKVDRMVDLKLNGPDEVSRNISKAFLMLQKKYDELTSKMIEKQSELEKSEKLILDKLKFNSDFTLSNKDEYKVYMMGEDNINQLNKDIRLLEKDLKIIENYVKIVMNLNFTIKNIIDWKMFKGET